MLSTHSSLRTITPDPAPPWGTLPQAARGHALGLCSVPKEDPKVLVLAARVIRFLGVGCPRHTQASLALQPLSVELKESHGKAQISTMALLTLESW